MLARRSAPVLSRASAYTASALARKIEKRRSAMPESSRLRAVLLTSVGLVKCAVSHDQLSTQFRHPGPTPDVGSSDSDVAFPPVTYRSLSGPSLVICRSWYIGMTG